MFEYRNHTIFVEESNLFSEGSYTVFCMSYCYKASSDAGMTFAMTPGEALSLNKKLIDDSLR